MIWESFTIPITAFWRSDCSIPYSDIRLRILQTREPREIDETFFGNDCNRPSNCGVQLNLKETNAYRLVNGENDGFPGMVVDRYNDTLVIKVYTSAWFLI